MPDFLLKTRGPYKTSYPKNIHFIMPLVMLKIKTIILLVCLVVSRNCQIMRPVFISVLCVVVKIGKLKLKNE